MLIVEKMPPIRRSQRLFGVAAAADVILTPKPPTTPNFRILPQILRKSPSFAKVSGSLLPMQTEFPQLPLL